MMVVCMRCVMAHMSFINDSVVNSVVNSVANLESWGMNGTLEQLEEEYYRA